MYVCYVGDVIYKLVIIASRTSYLPFTSVFINKKFFFSKTGLRYYGALNQLQYKRSCSLLEPLLGYLHAIRSFFKMGHESISVSDLDDFLSNISASVQR